MALILAAENGDDSTVSIKLLDDKRVSDKVDMNLLETFCSTVERGSHGITICRELMKRSGFKPALFMMDAEDLGVEEPAVVEICKELIDSGTAIKPGVVVKLPVLLPFDLFEKVFHLGAFSKDKYWFVYAEDCILQALHVDRLDVAEFILLNTSQLEYIEPVLEKSAMGEGSGVDFIVALARYGSLASRRQLVDVAQWLERRDLLAKLDWTPIATSTSHRDQLSDSTHVISVFNQINFEKLSDEYYAAAIGIFGSYNSSDYFTGSFDIDFAPHDCSRYHIKEPYKRYIHCLAMAPKVEAWVLSLGLVDPFQDDNFALVEAVESADDGTLYLKLLSDQRVSDKVDMNLLNTFRVAVDNSDYHTMICGELMKRKGIRPALFMTNTNERELFELLFHDERFKESLLDDVLVQDLVEQAARVGSAVQHNHLDVVEYFLQLDGIGVSMYGNRASTIAVLRGGTMESIRHKSMLIYTSFNLTFLFQYTTSRSLLLSRDFAFRMVFEKNSDISTEPAAIEICKDLIDSGTATLPGASTDILYLALYLSC
ncbi:hypothetical protein HDU76_007768 [Blyttiomyces sp. JEL0837]|nr:hypothetical protein HDU76_007768 [Blyttiomyces sp. JEL0837]